MTDIIYSATVDAKGALINLDLIGKKIEKVAKEGTKDFNQINKSASAGFDQISKSASASGIQIGAVAGIVSSLTTKFIELGQRMVAALSQGIKESIGLASELETTEAIFTGILQGNEPAAVAALQHIREESRKLGIDLTETSRAFLPFVASLEELDRVNRISAALAISQPEQGQLGARIALQEALSGNVQSLVRRFEIPKQLGKELARALDEGGVVEFLDVFEGIMKRLGRNVENLTDTFQFSFGRAAESGKQLQTAFAIPLLDELKSQFDDLNKTVAENFDDYTLIADTFGRVAANVAEILGTGLNDFLANLDTEQVTQIAEKFFDISEDARLLIETMTGANFPQSFIDGVESFADGLDKALNKVIDLNLQSQAGASKAAAEFQVWSDEMDRLYGKGTLAAEGMKQLIGIPGAIQAKNALAQYSGDAEDAALATASLAAGQEAYDKVLSDGKKAIEDSNKVKEENRKKTDDLAKAQKEGTGAAIGLTNAQIALNKAEADLATLTGDAEEAQIKINEAMADLEKDNDRKLEDIDIAAERKRLDIQIEFAQKREDAARNNLQKLADIRRKNQQDIADAATDLERKEEDIARKFAEERIDLEREQRQSRLDIETSFREKLEDIQKESAFDLDEAERTRDAVAFLRIIRQQQQQVSKAQTDRQREIDELQVQGERKKEELRIQQQREIEEAHIANERKLEDLRLNLERQIEAQNIAYAQQLEDLAIGETRKNEEAARARERDIEDAKLAYDRKLADLEESLAAELALIEEFGAQKLALLQEIADQEAAIAGESSGPSQTAGRPAGFGPNPGTITGHEGPAPSYTGGASAGFGSNPGTIGRAFGGLVNAGQSYPVGERGPELFTPNANGRIIPNNALLMPSMTPKSVVNNISRTNAPAVNFPVGDASLFNDPIFVAKLRNVILTAIDGVS
jgi:hypothetical protein